MRSCGFGCSDSIDFAAGSGFETHLVCSFLLSRSTCFGYQGSAPFTPSCFLSFDRCFFVPTHKPTHKSCEGRSTLARFLARLRVRGQSRIRFCNTPAITRIRALAARDRTLGGIPQALQQVVGAAAIYNHLLTLHGGVGTRPKNGGDGKTGGTSGVGAAGTAAAAKSGRTAACDCGGAVGSCKVGRGRLVLGNAGGGCAQPANADRVPFGLHVGRRSCSV